MKYPHFIACLFLVNALPTMAVSDRRQARHKLQQLSQGRDGPGRYRGTAWPR